MGNQKPKPIRQFPRAIHAVRILLRPQHRGPLLAAAVVGVVLAGFLYAWQRWGEPSLQTAEYVVSPEAIFVTPQPAWIHTDVKSDVVRTANLTELNLRNPKLVEEVAAAFALHPWVAKVVRVQKHFPARLDVELTYRRPVAAVEVAARNEPGLLFVDAEGVLLPSADFAPQQSKEFLRIAAGTETPAGVYGTAWGSERIAGAARLAAAWEAGSPPAEGAGVKGSTGPAPKRWRQVGLYRIVPLQSSGSEVNYELRTQEGARVIWGAAPGSESAGEPSPEQKIAALEQYVADKGPLDRHGAPPLVDLRELVGAPKSATAPTQPWR